MTASHCDTTGWSSDGGSGTDVNVECLDTTGHFTDCEFSLAYAVRAPFGLTGSATSRGAWAWANSQGRTTLYTPSKDYQYNGFGTGYLTVQKTGHSYTIAIPGNLSYNHSDVLVTSHSGGDYCDIDSWTTQSITVGCWNSSGESVNAMFDVVFQTYD